MHMIFIKTINVYIHIIIAGVDPPRKHLGGGGGGTWILRLTKPGKKVELKCLELLSQEAIVCKAHLACMHNLLLIGGLRAWPQENFKLCVMGLNLE